MAKSEYAVRQIDLHTQSMFLGVGPIGSVSQGQSGLVIEDDVVNRFVVIRSSDERQKDFVKVPYEAIKAIRYTRATQE